MKAHEVIDSSEKWCKGDMFQDQYGNPATELNYTTCCTMGAIEIAYGVCDIHDENGPLGKLRNHLNTKIAISSWNDKSSWLTVYSTLKKLDI